MNGIRANASRPSRSSTSRSSASGSRLLIGGVGYRWMGDASFGLAASDALAAGDGLAGVDVEDLGYGALYVAQDIGDARPPYSHLFLLAGVVRGREPGRLYRYAWQAQPASDAEIQARVYEAGAGVIDLDHLLIIAQYMKVLPPEVVVWEVEPLLLEGETLSAPVAALLPGVLVQIREEALALQGIEDVNHD